MAELAGKCRIILGTHVIKKLHKNVTFVSDNMWQQDDHIIPAMNSADQPRLYSYASGSDGEGDGQRRNSASSSCSRSSCSCDDHPDDDRTREDYDENTVYASLKDEGAQ